ncbi:MAG: phosphocholine cytidylyltransferase family protein [Holosporaceae bacterium]|jgi:choline kinase|nr:phosphocholine cytidylyltransferase family protein [Holosporaceae bacterium]
MKVIILAAGQGTRLRPLTNEYPKCMIKFGEKSIIDYIIETMLSVNLTKINVVTGYLSSVLRNHLTKYDRISFYHNENYPTTNMLYSLWHASAEFNDDVVISYSDIIYSCEILQKLINSPHKISVVIDKNWRDLWSLRMDDPLQDAESLVLDKNENIIEIGKKVNSYEKIQGQYIGLLKICREIWPKIIKFYNTLSAEIDTKSMHMTDFLQKLINSNFPMKIIPIHGDWLEIDSLEDLKRYNNNIIKFKRLLNQGKDS